VLDRLVAGGVPVGHRYALGVVSVVVFSHRATANAGTADRASSSHDRT
jgi:hypothetical protein